MKNMSCYELIIYWECMDCHRTFWSEQYDQCRCPHCGNGMGIPAMHSLEEVNKSSNLREEDGTET